jgi:hypothetical protein
MPAHKTLFFSDADDAMIRRVYNNRQKGGVKNIASRLGCSTGSVSRRAAELGCIRFVKKTQREWTQAEINIVETNAHKELTLINAALMRGGFESRSLDAIRKCCQRIGIGLRSAKTDSGIYTQAELARLMGIDRNTVQRHIRTGHLKADIRKGVDQLEYNITARDVRRFIIDYAPNVDIAACDKYWLIDILTGAIK